MLKQPWTKEINNCSCVTPPWLLSVKHRHETIKPWMAVSSQKEMEHLLLKKIVQKQCPFFLVFHQTTCKRRTLLVFNQNTLCQCMPYLCSTKRPLHAWLYLCSTQKTSKCMTLLVFNQNTCQCMPYLCSTKRPLNARLYLCSTRRPLNAWLYLCSTKRPVNGWLYLCSTRRPVNACLTCVQPKELQTHDFTCV